MRGRRRSYGSAWRLLHCLVEVGGFGGERGNERRHERRRFEIELRNIGAGLKFDANWRSRLQASVVLRQSLSNFGRFYSDDGVVCGIVVDWPPKHFGTEHSLAEAVEPAGQGVFHDKLKKLLCTPAAFEGVTSEDLDKVAAHGSYSPQVTLIRLPFLGHCEYLGVPSANSIYRQRWFAQVIAGKRNFILF